MAAIFLQRLFWTSRRSLTATDASVGQLFTGGCFPKKKKKKKALSAPHSGSLVEQSGSNILPSYRKMTLRRIPTRDKYAFDG